MEKGFINVGFGVVSLIFRYWDFLNCLCVGVGEGMVFYLIVNFRNGGGWVGGILCLE